MEETGCSGSRTKSTELEWLKWFYQNADFGPADDDVRTTMKCWFKEKTGKDLPEGYEDYVQG